MPALDWEALYTAAMLEHDPAEFVAKAIRAKPAMQATLEKFRDYDDSHERRALTIALRDLDVLLSQGGLAVYCRWASFLRYPLALPSLPAIS